MTEQEAEASENISNILALQKQKENPVKIFEEW